MELFRIEDYCSFEEHAPEDAVGVEVDRHICCHRSHSAEAVVGEEDQSHTWKSRLLSRVPVGNVMVLVEAEEVDCERLA